MKERWLSGRELVAGVSLR
ncbi:hypothetical protein E2C01_091470 [Portunus trituberculatus]|uniref:Uncharacterized protein n=1 Tax=Portunus trituberculatus TaxID=210409 RepID=A0A5B7JNN8_PORTR|nr:hypothetical protein [Portunus trituberculatus]